jgi:hypothetical protein
MRTTSARACGIVVDHEDAFANGGWGTGRHVSARVEGVPHAVQERVHRERLFR